MAMRVVSMTMTCCLVVLTAAPSLQAFEGDEIPGTGIADGDFKPLSDGNVPGVGFSDAAASSTGAAHAQVRAAAFARIDAILKIRSDVMVANAVAAAGGTSSTTQTPASPTIHTVIGKVLRSSELGTILKAVNLANNPAAIADSVISILRGVFGAESGERGVTDLRLTAEEEQLLRENSQLLQAALSHANEAGRTEAIAESGERARDDAARKIAQDNLKRIDADIKDLEARMTELKKERAAQEKRAK